MASEQRVSNNRDILQGVKAIQKALADEGINWSLSQVYARIADGTFKGAVAKVSHKNVLGSRRALKARIAALIAGSED